MKRIINGKMYNTATATLVGEHQYLNFNDVDYESEELYLKNGGMVLVR